MRKKGIGIISPANGLMHFFPNRIEYGKKYMEKNNFSIYFGKNSLKCVSYYSADVDDRISDINEAINDNNVDIIMASIGGYNSNQLLEKINYKKIKESNKIFCGYSDISCLILAIYVKTQKIMLHGPTFLAELCEYPDILINYELTRKLGLGYFSGMCFHIISLYDEGIAKWLRLKRLMLRL